MFGPPAGNPLNVCGVVVATCTGNALKRQIQNLRRAAIMIQWERSLIQHHIESAVMQNENCKGEDTMTTQGILWEDVLL
jgi:hypothetical protein